MRKALLSVIFSATCYAAFAQHATDTFHVYFDLNIPTLNRHAQEKIDSLMYNDKILAGKNILIVGYADYLGTEKMNKKLSEDRAENVRSYLCTYPINKSDIKLCMGRGQIDHTGPKDAEGYPADRKVDIVVEKTNTKRPIQKAILQATPAKKLAKPKPPVAINFKNDVTDIAIYQPGESYVLKTVYFLPQRHTLTQQSLPELDRLYNVLEEHPTLKVRIEGHVCCIRDYPDALDIENNDLYLSVNRARAIYNYLVQKGIDEERLKYAGYGKSRPIVKDEMNEEDAQKNRRVEVRVLSQ